MMQYETIQMKENQIADQNPMELFEQFYKTYLHVGKKKYTTTQQLMENPPVYDGYVVGSDQTWNPFVANSPEAFFFRKSVITGSTIGLLPLLSSSTFLGTISSAWTSLC